MSTGTLYLHQFTGSRLSGAGLDIAVATAYPWSGQVDIAVQAAAEGERGLAVRVPGWSSRAKFKLNDEPERTDVPTDGYLRLHRRWRPGDRLRLLLDLTSRLTRPDRRIDAVRGCVAVPIAESAATLPGIGDTIQLHVPGGALAIPYFQWDNRGGGAMRVWMPVISGA